MKQLWSILVKHICVTRPQWVLKQPILLWFILTHIAVILNTGSNNMSPTVTIKCNLFVSATFKVSPVVLSKIRCYRHLYTMVWLQYWCDCVGLSMSRETIRYDIRYEWCDTHNNSWSNGFCALYFLSKYLCMILYLQKRKLCILCSKSIWQRSSI